MKHTISKEDFIGDDSTVESVMASSYGRENKKIVITTNIITLESRYTVFSSKVVVYHGDDINKAITRYNKG